LIDWHARYLQQARWTAELRSHLLAKAGWRTVGQVLEVGCGTGAILRELAAARRSVHGLDLDPDALQAATRNASNAVLTRGDALALPYRTGAFDLVCCHYLLLWVREPVRALREMRRVTKREGYVLALAEPDHCSRTDQPGELEVLGKWQAESLRRQGADPGFGAHLSEAFRTAGIQVVETGQMRRSRGVPAPADRELEWAVLEADLAGSVAAEELARLEFIEARAWSAGTRVVHVPTYFALGRA
jgi:SAM-dependent methyltransferase